MKCIDFQDEAAKNPDHWINDGLKNHFAEELKNWSNSKIKPQIIYGHDLLLTTAASHSLKSWLAHWF